MTPQQFIDKWKRVELKERSSSQPHFLDLCRVLDVPNPIEADPTGEEYCFEKSLTKDSGGQGFADVWKKGCFGWEYKGKRKDLKEAFAQLSKYREALLDPPLLIVCDMNRFEIHTNFNNTVKQVHAFDLDGLADAKNLRKLHDAFTNPEALKPGQTQDELTKEVAGHLTQLADEFRIRHLDPHRAAHFMMKCIFCMFAEDVDLLPHNLFLNTLKKNKFDAKKLTKSIKQLFQAMSKPEGQFGEHSIKHFNGNLFDDAEVLELTPRDIRYLENAAEQDWSNVNPSIFGTLFERFIDPDKRSQTGANYTSQTDIETLLTPVMLAPLRREWEAVRAKAEAIYEKAKAAKKPPGAAFENLIQGFLQRLREVSVLDAACGSGNFLYVALRMLLDLEKEVLIFASARDKQLRFPAVGPKQLHGIEINPYAAELAQIVIWIGLLQWQKENGFERKEEPILETMNAIENRDAILDQSDPANPKEPAWPATEFIVGNPPFLGGSYCAAASATIM